MIGKCHVKSFVREGELEKIENYDKAIADKTQIWECHHRLEITLDGEYAHSAEDLKRMGMYYNRPYFELIFLTKTEHRRLHGKSMSEKHRKKLCEAKSEEVRKRMSEGRKGIKFSEEHKKNLRKAAKGRKYSEEARKRFSKPRSEFGDKYYNHYGYSRLQNEKQYKKEHAFYTKHNHKCRWEI